MRVTKKHLEVMRRVGRGADVWGYGDAMLCRELEKVKPPLVLIVKAQNAPKNGALRQPYFGVLLTDEGHRRIA